MRSEPSEIRFREEVRVEDIESIRRIVESTGFFYPEEVEVSVELVEDRLSNGLDSGYFFLIAEREDLPVAYSCYGPIASPSGVLISSGLSFTRTARGWGSANR